MADPECSMPGRLKLYIEFRESVADGRNLNTGMRLAAIDMRDRVLATRLMIAETQEKIGLIDKILRNGARLDRSF